MNSIAGTGWLHCAHAYGQPILATDDGLNEDTDRNAHADSETDLERSRREAAEAHEACLVIIRGARLGSRIVLSQGPVVIGRSLEADFQISDSSISREHCRVFEQGRRYWVLDLQSTNGTFVNEERIDKAPLRDGDLVRISQTVLKFVDETNIEAGYHSELYESTIRDALTGLYNRRHAMAVLETETAKAQRDGGAGLALVILDIDFFKAINDEFGHLAGDGVLKRITDIAGQRVRASDTFARIGGEEFALILPDTSHEEAHALAGAIRQSVESATITVGSEEHPVTISAGVATWTKEMKDKSELLRLADRRLYEAKCSGRNQVC